MDPYMQSAQQLTNYPIRVFRHIFSAGLQLLRTLQLQI